MFEFLFKYPRSVYARGQFALLGAWPVWILVLLVVAAAVGLAWLIRSRMAEAAPVIRGWRAWLIWSLQTLLAALEEQGFSTLEVLDIDDVIAHLTLMRADEAGYWKAANQHQPSSPEAGL